MHLVCCIKQVPDTAEVRIDPETNTLVRSGVESISNPYDVVALEAALTIKDRYDATVTALSMGPPQAEQVLREALSLGADEAILLSHRSFAGADTLATSYTLARAIERLNRQLPVDLVLCGKQAIDGDTAQVGPGIATRLGYTQFTSVTEIYEIAQRESTITVKRNVEGGAQIMRGSLPALLTIELSLGKPRRAPLALLVGSLRAGIPIWNGEDLEADTRKLGLKGSPTWVKAIFSPPAKKGGPVFDSRDGLHEAVEHSLDTLLSDAHFAEQLLNIWKG
jgi:electron transfer flavoprotein beta subunit